MTDVFKPLTKEDINWQNYWVDSVKGKYITSSQRRLFIAEKVESAVQGLKKEQSNYLLRIHPEITTKDMIAVLDIVDSWFPVFTSHSLEYCKSGQCSTATSKQSGNVRGNSSPSAGELLKQPKLENVEQSSTKDGKSNLHDVVNNGSETNSQAVVSDSLKEGKSQSLVTGKSLSEVGESETRDKHLSIASRTDEQEAPIGIKDCFGSSEQTSNNFITEFNYFCSKINFNKSNFDARAIRFMNEFNKYVISLSQPVNKKHNPDEERCLKHACSVGELKKVEEPVYNDVHDQQSPNLKQAPEREKRICDSCLHYRFLYNYVVDGLRVELCELCANKIAKSKIPIKKYEVDE